MLSALGGDGWRFKKIAILNGFFICALLSSCGPTRYSETSSAVIIHGGIGGEMNSKRDQYQEIIEKNKPIIIDGHVKSMDAFLAFSMPDACYTRNAQFSPHAVSYFGIFPSRYYTEKLADLLPKKVKKWYKSDISYYDWIGFANLGYSRLREIWPEGECSEELISVAMSYDPVSPP